MTIAATPLLIVFGRQFESIACHFSESHEGVLPTLYFLLRGLTALRSADDNFYQFNAPDFQGDSIYLDAKILKLTEIRDGVVVLMAKIESAIDELTFNLPECTIDPHANLYDEPRKRDAQWGFLDHKDNPWAGKNPVLAHILTDSAVFQEFAMRTADGTIRWKVGKCHRYAKEIYDTMMDICLAIMLTYGAPARGTELLSHLIRNVAGGSIRNVFLLFSVFVLRPTYHKMASATLADMTMARMPHPGVGELVKRMLVFLRPIYCSFQKFLHPYMEHNAQHFLFAGFSRPVMTRDLSLALSRFFWQRWEIPHMSVGKWRQIMAFFFQRNHVVFRQEEESMAAAQMGHSQKMHNEHYGGDVGFPDGWNDHVFQSTALVSAKYQLLLGFPPTLLLAITAGRERQMNVLATVRAIMQGRYVAPGQAVVAGQQGITDHQAITISSVARQVEDRITPTVALHINRAVAQGFAVFADAAHQRASTTLALAKTSITRPPSVGLLRKLREYLRAMKDLRPNRGFSNRSQGEVTQLMHDGSSNVAYVASTSKRPTIHRSGR